MLQVFQGWRIPAFICKCSVEGMEAKVVPFDMQNFQLAPYIVQPTVVFDFLVAPESVSADVGFAEALNQRFRISANITFLIKQKLEQCEGGKYKDKLFLDWTATGGKQLQFSLSQRKVSREFLGVIFFERRAMRLSAFTLCKFLFY